jgi:hypothetical protein
MNNFKLMLKFVGLLTIIAICTCIVLKQQPPAQQGVKLEVTCQYEQDDALYVDFVLDGEKYEGVAYEDMYDMLNDACLSDMESTL